MTGPDVEAWERRQADRTPTALAAVRADPRKRAVAIPAAVVVGLAVAWLHWLGLVAAGALVGLVSRTVPRAITWGVVVGLVAIALTLLTHPVDPAGFLAFRPPVYVTVAAGLVGPVWGSLARLVV